MPDLPKTRQSLLLRLKDRSEDAWQEFLAIYEKAILDYSRRKGLQQVDAEDVTQEVLSAVESKLKLWNPDPARGKFRGWLFRVAKNIAIDKVIERSKQPISGGSTVCVAIDRSALEDQDDADGFLADYRRNLLHWAATQVQGQVTRQSWLVFQLNVLEGRAAAEVAEQLGMTAGNVYAAKFRVTARIKKMVRKVDASNEQVEFT